MTYELLVFCLQAEKSRLPSVGGGTPLMDKGKNVLTAFG